MAASFVKNIGSAAANMATSATITVPAGGIAQGDLIVVRVNFEGNNQVSVSDDGGNTYTRRVDRLTPPDYVSVFTAIATSALSASDDITLSFSKDSGSIVIDQFTGLGDFDAVTTDTGSSATPTVSDTPAGVGLVMGM